MLKKWYRATLVRHMKNNWGIILLLLFFMFMFFVSCVDGFSFGEMLEIMFTLKYNSGVGMMMYSGFIIVIAIFPLRYCEFIAESDCKEVVLRINNKRKFDKVVFKALSRVVIIEFAIIAGALCVMAQFMEVNKNLSVFRIVCCLAMYGAAIYTVAAWYYKCRSFGGGRMLWGLVALLFFANNLFSYFTALSISYILLHENDLYISEAVIVWAFVAWLSTKLNFRKVRKNA